MGGGVGVGDEGGSDTGVGVGDGEKKGQKTALDKVFLNVTGISPLSVRIVVNTSI